MSSYLADRVLAAENVEVLHHTEIRRMHGGGRTETVEIEKDRTGETSTAPAAVFMFIGAAPRTAWLLPEVRAAQIRSASRFDRAQYERRVIAAPVPLFLDRQGIQTPRIQPCFGERHRQ